MSDFGISVIQGVITLLLFVLTIVAWSNARWNPTPSPLPKSIRRRVEPPWFLYFDFIPIILFLLLAVDHPPWINAIMALLACYIAISAALAFRINRIYRSLSGELAAAQTNDIRLGVKRRFVMR